MSERALERPGSIGGAVSDTGISVKHRTKGVDEAVASPRVARAPNELHVAGSGRADRTAAPRDIDEVPEPSILGPSLPSDMPNPSSRATALKLYVVLSRAYDAVTAHANDDIARHRLSPTAFASLEALYHKGPMMVGELQRRILISSGGITYVIDQLAAKGLVTRRPSDEDRRAIWAELTPAGRRLMDRIFPPHAEAIERAMDGLTRREQEETIRLLRKLGVAAVESRASPE